jgi:hypothetical protein
MYLGKCLVFSSRRSLGLTGRISPSLHSVVGDQHAGSNFFVLVSLYRKYFFFVGAGDKR